MNKNTLKAIAKRVDAGEKEFTIGKYTYYVNYERKTVINYFGDNTQVTYFDWLPLKKKGN